jgi:hypothetical protein
MKRARRATRWLGMLCLAVGGAVVSLVIMVETGTIPA